MTTYQLMQIAPTQSYGMQINDLLDTEIEPIFDNNQTISPVRITDTRTGIAEVDRLPNKFTNNNHVTYYKICLALLIIIILIILFCLHVLNII